MSTQKNRWIYFSLLAISLLLYACDDSNDNKKEVDDYWMPGEYETHQAVMLASPTVDYKVGWSMLDVQADMIKEILVNGNVDYAVIDEQDSIKLVDKLIARGVSQNTIDSKINFLIADHADLWVRDYGGIYMRNKKGDLAAVDFDFDGYRLAQYGDQTLKNIYEYDNDLSVRIADKLDASVRRSTLIAEGGNLHFNGKGTVIAVQSSFTQSNPDWTVPEMEAELKRVFNIKKVIWLPRGLATDANPVEQTPYIINDEPVFNLGVNHADEMVMWINETTLLLPEVTEEEYAAGDTITQLNYEILADVYDILSNATDQDGNQITIVRVPEPGAIIVELVPGDLMYDFLAGLTGMQNFPSDGSPIKFALAASYMNFVPTNDLVLVPKLYLAGRDVSLQAKDESFKQIIEMYYPGRRVVQVNTDAITVGGGGMHCISQQIPTTE